MWTAFTRCVSRATVPGDQGFPGKRPLTWGGMATKSATSTSRTAAMLSNQNTVGDDVPLRTSQKCPAHGYDPHQDAQKQLLAHVSPP